MKETIIKSTPVVDDTAEDALCGIVNDNHARKMLQRKRIAMMRVVKNICLTALGISLFALFVVLLKIMQTVPYILVVGLTFIGTFLIFIGMAGIIEAWLKGWMNFDE